MNFRYSVQLYALPPYNDRRPVEKLTGTLQAPDWDCAQKQVVVRASARREQLERERGGLFGYNSDEIKLQHVPDGSPSDTSPHRAVVTPTDSEHCTLKSLLDHRASLHMDQEKLNNELTDTLWYLFLLLDKLGLTFEEVAMGILKKLERRHQGSSKSHAESSGQKPEGQP